MAVTSSHVRSKNHKKLKGVNPFRNKLKNQQSDKKKPVIFKDFEDDDQDEFLDNLVQSENKTPTYHKLTKQELKTRADEILEKQRKKLPVYQNKDEIMTYINKNQVTVLIGETGSGKSTQIPQFLINSVSKGKKIAVTQPRRVAAISLAGRVAAEYGCIIGDEVGYSVRFDNRSNDKRTKLKYLTDGMLLRELMMDKKLSQYEYLIIDEAHERTILTDLLLGFIKGLLQGSRKNDLKIIVMSATLQADRFSKFFDDAPILFVKGRTYPVENFHLSLKDSEEQTDMVESMIRSVIQVNSSEPFGGDILCFLPGQEEIDKAVAILQKISPILKDSYIKQKLKIPEIVPLPLYAALSPSKQLLVFNKLNSNKFQRKIILATNIAETSVTIPGVKYVIDSGLRKVKIWRHELGLSTLLTVPVSRASCQQRSGRAGRESEGKCFRLFKENDFVNLPSQSESEIIRCDISNPLLILKKVGVKDILNWSWLESPGKNAIVIGLEELYSLGALNDSGELTEKGEKMALLPLAPHLSNVLLEAMERNCISAVLDIVACLSVENLLLNPNPDIRDIVNEKRYQSATLGRRHGDLIMLKEFYDIFNGLDSVPEKKQWCQEMSITYRGFQNVIKIRRQLKDYLKKIDANLEKNEQFKNKGTASNDDEESDDDFIDTNDKKIDVESILKCFLYGFVKNTAIGMPDRSYRTTTTGEPISIHPSSMMFSKKDNPGIMYTEYVFTSKGFARNVSRIELEWLQEVAMGVKKFK
ncbi:related to Probable ATP-dependent RNA helicase DHR2 [Hanseniaspora guilliermondii]|uniref:RNA helicase n=1 Tax=Hanseniaspora guilliermondii TaxID=56406 RepID=A0A1L0B579_9ASCO|nr:related to Probable ATP-dependent RNA helicase DHR2 [Hanseniaspora guilliermondii]